MTSRVPRCKGGCGRDPGGHRWMMNVRILHPLIQRLALRGCAPSATPSFPVSRPGNPDAGSEQPPLPRPTPLDCSAWPGLSLEVWWRACRDFPDTISRSAARLPELRAVPGPPFSAGSPPIGASAERAVSLGVAAARGRQRGEDRPDWVPHSWERHLEDCSPSAQRQGQIRTPPGRLTGRSPGGPGWSVSIRASGAIGVILAAGQTAR